MWRAIRCTYKFYGDRSIITYPIDRIYKEVSFIAYYFHWKHDEIMDMEHKERRRWCDEISRINSELNDEPKNMFSI